MSESCKLPTHSLQLYIAVARASREPAVMENALNLALRTEKMIAAHSLKSCMPTAMKVKICQLPVFNLLLDFAQLSPQWRALIVRILYENVEGGSGHLTVNRAKQLLKELAKRAGLASLSADLSTANKERRQAAIILLGWLKSEKAIAPLIEGYHHLAEDEKDLVLGSLEKHYRAKLPYHLKWQMHDKCAPSLQICALIKAM